jgi:hypothetical protein
VVNDSPLYDLGIRPHLTVNVRLWADQSSSVEMS